MAEDESHNTSQENAIQRMTTPERRNSVPQSVAFSSISNRSTSHELPDYYCPPESPNRILSVPTEVTSMIFELVDNAWVEFMRDYYHVNDDDLEDPPVPLRPGLVFLGVCRLWRQIALGHKKLWATIVHVTPDELVPLPLLSFYLERSKPHPLDIVIRAQNFYWPGPEEDELDIGHDYPDYIGHEQSYSPWTTTDVRKVLDALIPHAPRWRQFALNTCIGGFDARVLLPIQSVDAPLLEKFEVLTHIAS